MLKKIILAFLLIGLVVFIGIQFVPVNRNNPPVLSEPNWNSPETRAVVARACYDCHSNETKWPWYSYVAPVSWLVVYDTNEGREHLNFSEWNTARQEDLEEIIEVVKEGEMPLKPYLLMHPEAKLNAQEVSTLIEGLHATLGQQSQTQEDVARQRLQQGSASNDDDDDDKDDEEKHDDEDDD